MQADDYCPRCGRLMPKRRAGRPGTPSRFCSRRCRGNPLKEVDRHLEQAILDLLSARKGGATICPSEAARAVESERWRPLMEATRQAARRLWLAGRVEILQRGRVVEPSTAAGAIRLRLARSSGHGESPETTMAAV